MSLPGFKSSVQLTQDPPRLTDKMNGRTLTLSQGEAKLLAHYDGHRTHDELARLAQADGFPVEPLHVAGLLERVAHAGFMDGPPPQLGPAAPELELPTDRVPALRSDLKIVRSEKSAGMMEVTDPERGQTFSLYDFEASIARMLNGKRTAFQVIEAAAKIGIPVTLESLRKFIRQLRAYHFIIEEQAEPISKEGGTWSPRAQWTPEVRELFQSALRRFRAGKYREATEYIVALLQIDPNNRDAVELRTRVEKKAKESPEPASEFTFDELHGGADAAGDFMEMDEPVAPTPSLDKHAPPVELTPPSGPHQAALPPEQRKNYFDFQKTSLTDSGSNPAYKESPKPEVGTPLVLDPPPPKKEWRPTTLEFSSPTVASAPKDPIEVLPSGAAAETPPPKWEPTIHVPQAGARDVIPSAAFTGPAVSEPTPVMELPNPDSAAAPAPAPMAAQPPVSEPEPTPAPKKRSLMPWILLVFVVLVGGAAAFPVQTTARVPVKLESIVLGSVKPDRAVKLDKLIAVDGAKVEAGEPVVGLSLEDAQQNLASAKNRRAQLELQLKTLSGKVNPKQLKKAQGAVAKLQKMSDAVAAQKAKLTEMREKVAAMDPKKPAVKKGLAAIDKKLKMNAKGEALVNQKLAAAQAGVAKLTHDDEKKPILDLLDAVKADQEKAEALTKDVALKAPVAGIWRPGKKGPGAELAKDETAGEIAEPNKLKIVGAIPNDAEPNAIAECGGTRTPVTLNGDTAKTGAPMNGGSCTLELRRAKKPLALSLLGR